jgi:hypothetical protein
VGVNDLAGVPINTGVTLNTLFTNGVNGGNGGSELAFSFTIAGFGTFVETANPVLLNSISIGNSQGVSYFLVGNFTPTFGGFTPGPASFRVSFEESAQGDSISYAGSGTFASPPERVSVPEPGILALMGLGFGGLAFIRRRRDSRIRRRLPSGLPARVLRENPRLLTS